MRIEATLPDSRRAELQALEAELHLSKSQVIDEALSIFVKAVLEAKRGNRLGIFEAGSRRALCELASPSLSHLEWASQPRRMKISRTALARMKELSAQPPAPPASLKRAMARHRRERKRRGA